MSRSVKKGPFVDEKLLKRVIEMGPDAIVVPMVNSVEEAKFAIDNCIYPPDGKRGFGPCRAVGYGIDDLNEYIDHGHKEMLRFLQVETEAAVKIMDQVAKIPYFDGFIIGLTATPDKRTFAFFYENIVSEYSREQAIIDGVNVGEDI